MGGGSKSSMPTPTPSVPQISGAALTERSEDSLKKRKGVSSTILSNNLGMPGTNQQNKTLLGG